MTGHTNTPPRRRPAAAHAVKPRVEDWRIVAERRAQLENRIVRTNSGSEWLARVRRI